MGRARASRAGLKPGARMRFEAGRSVLHGEVLARRFQGRRTVRLWTEDPGGVAAVVDRIGTFRCRLIISATTAPPIVSAIKPSTPRTRRDCGTDCRAAPRLSSSRELRAAGIERATVTLHVGYGTFKPVRVERVEDREVDPEFYAVSDAAAQALTRAP